MKRSILHSLAGSRTTPRAFTLVEVLVVIAIIGIASAVVVPAMLNAGTLHVQAAARMVISDFMIAQNDAIAQQRRRSVVFDAAANKYELRDENDHVLDMTWKGGGVANYVVELGADSRFQGVQITNVTFAQNKVSYDELGAPDHGGSVDLVANGLQYRVTVAAFTGKTIVTKLP